MIFFVAIVKCYTMLENILRQKVFAWFEFKIKQSEPYDVEIVNNLKIIIS